MLQLSSCGRNSRMKSPLSLEEWEVVQKFVFMAAIGIESTSEGILLCQHQLKMCTGGESNI